MIFLRQLPLTKIAKKKVEDKSLISLNLSSAVTILLGLLANSFNGALSGTLSKKRKKNWRLENTEIGKNFIHRKETRFLLNNDV